MLREEVSRVRCPLNQLVGLGMSGKCRGDVVEVSGGCRGGVWEGLGGVVEVSGRCRGGVWGRE